MIDPDDNIDIYDDLDLNKTTDKKESDLKCSKNAELFDEIHLYSELNSLETEVARLREENQRLLLENEDYNKNITIKDKQIKVLKNNISSLYKTAKLEIDRKDQELANLQREFDSVVFRRISTTSQVNSNQKTDLNINIESTKQNQPNVQSKDSVKLISSQSSSCDLKESTHSRMISKDNLKNDSLKRNHFNLSTSNDDSSKRKYSESKYHKQYRSRFSESTSKRPRY